MFRNSFLMFFSLLSHIWTAVLFLNIDGSLLAAVGNANFSSSQFSCNNLPQPHVYLCKRYPNLMRYVQEGILQAQLECQTQFSKNRWNCTSIDNNPFIKLLERGFRESAFSYAILSAGITYKLTNACGEGQFPDCFCQENIAQTVNASNPSSFHFTNKSSWHMTGCDDNVEVASNMVLDASPSRRGRSSDTRALVDKHNNDVGVKALQDTVTLDCRCHGMSGTCATKTCMRKMPPFSVVGDYLSYKFHGARRVIHKKTGYGFLLVSSGGRKEPREARADELLYYEKSPNFCAAEPAINWAGTSGRQCVLTSDPRQKDSCEVLCCKRGYYTLYQETIKDCNCRVESLWSTVVCDKCVVQEPKHHCR